MVNCLRVGKFSCGGDGNDSVGELPPAAAIVVGPLRMVLESLFFGTLRD